MNSIDIPIFVQQMNSVPKHKVLLFTSTVLFVLGIMSYAIPDKGLNLGFMKLEFLPSQKVWSKTVVLKKDISEIVQNVDTSLIESKDGAIAASEKPIIKKTTKSPEGEAKAKINLNSGTAGIRIRDFFEQLALLSTTKKKVRIVHFGDSQIEGDRMTAFIRQRLQEKFGGYGPGLIPAVNVYQTSSFKQSCSANFERYTCFGGTKLSNRRYGIMNSAARFTKEKLDSTIVDLSEGWIEISPSSSAYGRSRSYSNVKMFYNSCFEPCKLEVTQNGQLIHEEDLNTDGKYHSVNLNFPGNPGTLKFTFRARQSPNIMGFSLDGDSGLQVDNVAMRGSSGTFFGSIDQSLFAQQMADLSVDMVIMQFGGNSMPMFKEKAQVDNFGKYILGQLRTLMRLRPNAVVLFIGPSDMSTLIDGEYQTYPLLPYCVEQLKKAAKNCGVGYWDLYEAMGGQNSMPAWVEKGLAGKDYIHFSPKGASIASQIFYDALMNQYLEKKVN